MQQVFFFLNQMGSGRWEEEYTPNGHCSFQKCFFYIFPYTSLKFKEFQNVKHLEGRKIPPLKLNEEKEKYFGLQPAMLKIRSEKGRIRILPLRKNEMFLMGIKSLNQASIFFECITAKIF